MVGTIILSKYIGLWVYCVFVWFGVVCLVVCVFVCDGLSWLSIVGLFISITAGRLVKSELIIFELQFCVCLVWCGVFGWFDLVCCCVLCVFVCVFVCLGLFRSEEHTV